MKEKFRNLTPTARLGIVMSLMATLGWCLCVVAILFFEQVFAEPSEIGLFRFALVPALLVLLGVAANVLELHRLLNIKPRNMTMIMTMLHGFWGQYVALQIHPAYNGYLILFLYSIGLQYVKVSAGFFYTVLFSVINLLFSTALIYLLKIEIGTDEKLFLFFFAFNGAGASIMNHFGRLTQNKLKMEQRHRLHSFKQLQKMFYPHQLQMIADGKEVEQTMPVGEGRATVLAFDIIGSSLVEHEQSHAVFHETFGMCSELMMASYNHADQDAEAYLVNETGDGFICSVGYPFRTPQNQTQAAVAYRLALQFIEVFQNNLVRLDYPDPVHASIAIATGEVHCAYSKHLPIKYHAYGKGIVLATRYEEVRRQMSKVIDIQGSIIILQSAVYKTLPLEIREQFQEFRLEEGLVRVRDDGSARSLYYQIIPPRHPMKQSA